jgi:hypothetical protein
MMTMTGTDRIKDFVSKTATGRHLIRMIRSRKMLRVFLQTRLRCWMRLSGRGMVRTREGFMGSGLGFYEESWMKLLIEEAQPVTISMSPLTFIECRNLEN